MGEMFRVIKPGGVVAIGFRDDKQMSNLSPGDKEERITGAKQRDV